MTRNSDPAKDVAALFFQAGGLFGMYAVAAFLLAPIALYDAFFLHLIWVGHIRELIPAAPELPIVAFAIIRVFLSLLQKPYRPKRDPKTRVFDGLAETTFGWLIAAPSAWFVCWVLTWWMS